jgi:hypothetical protein
MHRAALDSQKKMVTRRFVEWCCQGVASKDYLSEILAIHNTLRRRCRYMRDPRTIELVKAPYLIFEEIMDGGRPSIDCDDFGGAEEAACLSAGCQVDLVTVAFRDAFYEGRRQFSHVFARAKEPRTNMWIVLDPVAGDEKHVQTMISRAKAAAVWPCA